MKGVNCYEQRAGPYEYRVIPGLCALACFQQRPLPRNLMLQPIE